MAPPPRTGARRAPTPRAPRGSRTSRLALRALALVLALAPVASLASAAPAGAHHAQDPTTTTIPTTDPTVVDPTGPPAGSTFVGTPPEGPVTAREWIVIDADTGQVLAGQDHHVAVLAASTVKTVTALLTVDQLGIDDVVTIDPAVANVACNCLDGFGPGQNWRVGDLLGALLIGSDNDVAYALAIAATGSVEAFGADATALGARLGIRDSTFTDPAGLDGAEGYRGGTLVSAYDLALLARNALALPELSSIVASRSHVVQYPDGSSQVLESGNHLLDTYDGAIGFKTGYTNAARASLIGAATHDGRTIITVVLGAEETFDLTRRLLDLGFATPPGAGVDEYVPTVRMGPAAVPFDASQLVLAATAAPAGATGTGGGGGIPGFVWIALPLAVLLVALFLRRRSVIRRRKARARNRQFMDARRRYLREAEREEW